MTKTEAIVGCILGTAVGDALGLPYEALAKRKIPININKYGLLFGKGMVSDDTEHTCIVAQSLLVSRGDKQIFAKALSWRLRCWLLGIPAGIGFATLRGILKLWLGFSPEKSGVFSAGNGPAMRSAIIGVCYGDDREKMCDLVRVSTRITHRDPKAEYGALAVAIAAYLSSQNHLTSPQEYYQTLADFLPQKADEFLQLIQQACNSAIREETAATYAFNLGLKKGITGYIYHTVPVVIQVWLRQQTEYQKGIEEIIHLGGDTDTTAAILGGIIGAKVGKKGIPQQWLNDLWEFPRNVAWMEELGTRLTGTKTTALPLPIIPLLFRNLFFAFVIIIHGFSRILFFFN